MEPSRRPYPTLGVHVVGRTSELIRGDKGPDEDGNFREPIEKPRRLTDLDDQVTDEDRSPRS